MNCLSSSDPNLVRTGVVGLSWFALGLETSKESDRIADEYSWLMLAWTDRTPINSP